MSIDYQKLRLDGIYQQDADGNLMLRVKIPAGVLSSIQAEAVCDIAERLSNGRLHLTSRGSIEIHYLQYADLAEAFRRLAAVGLTSRGACGGAVRGISCSTTFAADFPLVQGVARRLHRHFAGNPHFEGLPKKFKIGIDGGYAGARHLIQDLGLVQVGTEEGRGLFDVWCAGGLGREPQAAFLLEERVPEERLIPLIEAVVQVYRAHTPPPKRLKFLLGQLDEERFRALLQQELAARPQPVRQLSVDGPLTAAPAASVEAVVFAGELAASALRGLARLAAEAAGGFLALTADQNVALLLENEQSSAKVKEGLAALGFAGDTAEQQVVFRVCPGSHECKMGLCATRDVARQLIAAAGPEGVQGDFAISGCPNACSQPQLAAAGIVTEKLVKVEDGSRSPRFALLRRTGDGLGEVVADGLNLDELLKAVSAL